MIAAWVIHCLVVSALLAGAAFLAERALRLQGRAARGVWVVAMAGSLLLPTARALVPADAAGAARLGDAEVVAAPDGAAADDPAAPVVERAAAFLASGLDRAAAAAAGATGRVTARVRAVPGLGAGLLALWVLASLGVALVVARSARRLGRERRRWGRLRVSDVDVLVSRDRGPGVVGLRHAEIVVPSWVLDLEEGLQRLVCLHEREHVRVGDHRVFAAALAAAALVPWNLPLWWQLRRLRLAIECDCDRRVLRREVSPRLYGELLLRVGGRPSRMPLLTAPLAERKSHLARRIEVMTSGNVENRAVRTMAVVAVASGLVFLSCEAPAPTQEEAPEATGPDAAEYSFETREVETDDAALPTGEERPLVVVDGEVQGVDMAVESLDPQRIERIEVLKGLAARDVYGDRGAHGVIEITTKDAASGASADATGAGAGSVEAGPAAPGPVAEAAERTAETAAPADGRSAFRIVGSGPMGAMSDALLVIDGVVQDDHSALETLEAARIDRIEIVKGAAAIGTYGERAREGAVHVHTKGSAGGS